MATKKRRARTNLWWQQRGLCYYCDRPTVLINRGEKPVQPLDATLDHIVPLSAGGAFDPDINCVMACRACNHERGNRDGRMFLLEKRGML